MRTLPHTTDLQQLVKRRKGLAVAAAVGVAGCNLMAPHAAPAPAPAPVASTTAADAMVSSYTSDIEKALDNIDRKRLSLARQAGQNPAGIEVAKVNPIPASDATPETKPASAEAPIAPKQTTKTPAAVPVLAVGMPIPDATAAPVTSAGMPMTSAGMPTGVAPAAGAKAVAPTLAATMPSVAATPNALPQTLPGLQPAATYEAIDTPPRGPEQAMPAINVALALPTDVATPAPSLATATISPLAAPASAMGAMTAMLAPASPTSPAMAAPPAAAAEPTVDDALTILRENISEHPTLNTALALALLDGKSSNEISQSLSEPDQKLLADLTAALDSMKTAAPAAPLAERAAPILDVAKRWQAEANLALPRLVLASRVDSYGVYTAVEPTFEQGKRHTVIIYCEVNNFGSKKTDDGWYNTKLTQQESLITEDKLLVWRPNPEDVEDRSLNQRHDFYLVKKLTLPETLAAGKYTLRMDVTDANTGKRAIQNMEIVLVTK